MENLMRERLDKVIQEISQHQEIDQAQLINQLSIGSSEETESSALYAWVPIPTLMCPSELNTTSDSCSSVCNVGSCSKSEQDSDTDDEQGITPTPLNQPPRPRFNEISTNNPF
jgi:hypothetical protein